ncbi:hypothetical protein BJ912DRAFT_1059660 [Pholiota molesta]|nr:hypothetical protein BJ912DRAFT_1059660 [Pholiota molesta]
MHTAERLQPREHGPSLTPALGWRRAPAEDGLCVHPTARPQAVRLRQPWPQPTRSAQATLHGKRRSAAHVSPMHGGTDCHDARQMQTQTLAGRADGPSELATTRPTPVLCVPPGNDARPATTSNAGDPRTARRLASSWRRYVEITARRRPHPAAPAHRAILKNQATAQTSGSRAAHIRLWQITGGDAAAEGHAADKGQKNEGGKWGEGNGLRARGSGSGT